MVLPSGLSLFCNYAGFANQKFADCCYKSNNFVNATFWVLETLLNQANFHWRAPCNHVGTLMIREPALLIYNKQVHFKIELACILKFIGSTLGKVDEKYYVSIYLKRWFLSPDVSGLEPILQLIWIIWHYMDSNNFHLTNISTITHRRRTVHKCVTTQMHLCSYIPMGHI